jgi:uncharacterized membrane protein
VLDASRAERIERSVTVARPAEELYAVWRDLEKLPRFMRRIESVEVLSPTLSRWRAKAPVKAEWEAEIINEVPNRLIGWKTSGHPRYASAGSVHFTPAPGGRGTEVRVVLEFEPPGPIGKLASKVFPDRPDATLREDLRNFKRLMETGELPRSTP